MTDSRGSTLTSLPVTITVTSSGGGGLLGGSGSGGSLLLSSDGWLLVALVIIAAVVVAIILLASASVDSLRVPCSVWANGRRTDVSSRDPRYHRI